MERQIFSRLIEICPRIQSNPQAYYVLQNVSAIVPVLDQLNSIHNFPFFLTSILYTIFSSLFIYSLLTLGYRVLSKWFDLVRLACVLSRAPSTDGTPMFTQSSLLASVFEAVDFLVVGGRDLLLVGCGLLLVGCGLLLVGCGDLSYGLYFSWPLL